MSLALPPPPILFVVSLRAASANTQLCRCYPASEVHEPREEVALIASLAGGAWRQVRAVFPRPGFIGLADEPCERQQALLWMTRVKSLQLHGADDERMLGDSLPFPLAASLFARTSATGIAALAYQRFDQDPGYACAVRENAIYDELLGKESRSRFDDLVADHVFKAGDSLPVFVNDSGRRIFGILRLTEQTGVDTFASKLVTTRKLVKPEVVLTRELEVSLLNLLTGELGVQKFQKELGIFRVAAHTR